MYLQTTTKAQAEKLKELGFDYKCEAYYHPNNGDLLDTHFGLRIDNQNDGREILAPSIQLALKWLRDEKAVDVSIRSMLPRCYYYMIQGSDHSTINLNGSGSIRKTYEEVESEVLDYALNYLLKKRPLL